MKRALSRAKKAIRMAVTLGLPRASSPWRGFAEQTMSWWQDQNVLGMGVGERYTDGVPTGETALRVYVERKLPVDKIDDRFRLDKPLVHPDSGKRLPLDVVETGLFEAYGAKGGSIIYGGTRLPGRIGCRVSYKNEPDRAFILSNAHVLGLAGSASQGDAISLADGSVIGRFERALPLSNAAGFPNLVDAAIAEVDPALVASLIWGVGAPTGITSYISPGISAASIALESGECRTGIVRDAYSDVRISYDNIQSGMGMLGFDDLVMCDAFTFPGDSGSLVLDTKRRIIGLLIGGSPRFSLFCRIDKVMALLDVEPVL